ncbi:MAG TPA: aminoglycoside phosphotransferase family protein [Dongiaceae bacterium]|jgi:streptomycin 6-kinase|nr:aminoglycoside phosphotransferase family protein [Dongiaceae bacterium]
MFDRYLKRWGLTRDGVPIVTHSSDLLPVRQDGRPAMLKIAREAEERRGASLMTWWDGDGAARVLAHDGDAVLLERATGNRSLAAVAHGGADDEASRILCDVAARLHAPRNRPLPDLIPLSAWFAELEPAAAKHGGILAHATEVARGLLNDQHEAVVLHGDLHHGNVLDFGARGWLAIDPKGLLGERGFDFANIFRNPDLEIAKAPGRVARQAIVIAEAAHLDRTRLLRWVLAYAGLSAAWILKDGDDATLDLTVAEIAAAEIARA